MLAQKEPIVSVENVDLFLPGDSRQEIILHDICLEVRPGQHFALLGQNGSGKSTILRLLAGDIWPARGMITWLTADGRESSLLAGRSITSLVSPARQEEFQRQSWYISGRELLLAGMEKNSCLNVDNGSDLESSLTDLAGKLGLDALLDAFVPELSQGQLRILLLARALLRQPSLLLLDEYTDGLDAHHTQTILGAIAEYAMQGTVIMASHRQDDLPDWCVGRKYVHDGRLFDSMPEGSPEASKADVDLVKQFMPESVPTSSQPQKQISDRLESKPRTARLLELENVTVFIDRTEILHKITWTISKGEHWHLKGENGSGKSTLLRLLAGDEFVAAGGMLKRFFPTHAELNCSSENNAEDALVETLQDVRSGIRLVSDLGQALYSYDLTGFELLCTGFDNSIGLYRDFSPAEQEQAWKLMHLLFAEDGAEKIAESRIRLLSSGQLRRLFLARALAGRPQILLLDEPCTGLDSLARKNYLELLDKLVLAPEAGGIGIHLVFVSHHEEDLPKCINRTALMKGGYLEIV